MEFLRVPRHWDGLEDLFKRMSQIFSTFALVSMPPSTFVREVTRRNVSAFCSLCSIMSRRNST